jgi:hypothetical protein
MPPRASTSPTGTARILPSLSLQSTPYSRGSGSHCSCQCQECLSHYKPYLIEDIRHQRTTPFEKFLTDILHHPPQDSANTSAVVSGSCFQTLLTKYRERVSQETDRYPPFIELANHVIDQLHSPNPKSKKFCRNDPVTVKGSHAERKPDVVVVFNKSLEMPGRRGKNLMEHGPKQAPFWWSELLFFFELKLRDKCLEPQDPVTGGHSSSTFILILPFVRLNSYGSSGSVGVELSCRSTAFPVYISPAMRGTHFPHNGLSTRFGFGFKAKSQCLFFKPVVQIKEAEAGRHWKCQ